MHPAARTTHRRPRAPHVVALLAAALVASLAGPALAQDDRTLTVRELGLTATAGFGADAAVRGWTPVEVRLSPTRLFGGTIAVTTSTDVSQLTEPREVEVAAGTEKVFRFVVPPANQIQVRVTEPGRDPLVTRVNLARTTSSYLVGVLGQAVPPTAPPVAAVASDLRGTYASVDPAWLDVSPRALDTISTLVVSSTVLQQLGEDAVVRLRTAVALGMELVVTVDRPGALDLAGLPWAPATGATSASVTVADRTHQVLALDPAPDAWSLTGADLADGSGTEVLIAAVTAGRGRVAVVGVGLGTAGLGTDARLWGQVLQPSARSLELTDTFSSVHRPVQLAGQAVQSRGLSLPSLPWLTIFLLAFVVLVGPVNGFVVTRIGRPELAWLTIPAITLVFATGAYVGARGAQPPVGLAATASFWVEGEGQQLAISALRSPREGEHTLLLPGSDWAVLPATQTQAPTRLDRSGPDTTVTMDLGALQVGTVLAWRPTPTAAPLEVTARMTALNSAVVQITNTTAGAIDGVEVRAGTRSQRVGDLAPGESREVAFDGLRDLATLEPWRDDFDGLRDLQGITSAPASLEAVLRWQVLDGNPGLVWATGTTPNTGTALPRTGSGDTDDLGEFLAVGVNPTYASADLSPVAVGRTILAGTLNQQMHRISPLALEGSGQVVMRYRLPGGADVTQLLPTLDRGIAEGQGFGGGCFEQPVFDEQGNMIGSEVICEDVAVPDCPPGADCIGLPGAVPECPDDAECTLDGPIFEMCRVLADGVRECSITVLEPNAPPVPGFDGQVQLEVFDHASGRWEFVRGVIVRGNDGVTLDPARFLSPLGEVYVRASGEFWPFDYSGRGIGATLGASA